MACLHQSGSEGERDGVSTEDVSTVDLSRLVYCRNSLKYGMLSWGWTLRLASLTRCVFMERVLVGQQLSQVK